MDKKKEKKFLVVGTCGAGKTTLTAALNTFYKAGSVEVVDLEQVPSYIDVADMEVIPYKKLIDEEVPYFPPSKSKYHK
jgi:predicted PilT family ATPase